MLNDAHRLKMWASDLPLANHGATRVSVSSAPQDEATIMSAFGHDHDQEKAPPVGAGQGSSQSYNDSSHSKGNGRDTQGGSAIPHPAIAFLQAFYGGATWHLVAIEAGKKKPDIKATSFSGDNRETRAVEWFTRWNEQRYNIYFCPNSLKRNICKKATKDDVAAAQWLWSDIDPPKDAANQQVAEWRAQRLADYAAGLPPELPPPTFHIDSGRGFWRFWKLKEPIAVDGKDGEATSRVESYGRGIEQAFPEAADACRNIDRIARLPGTINHKTGKLAAVLDFHPERAYALSDFPQVIEADGPSDQEIPRSPIAFDLALLPERLKRTITEGAYDDFDRDRSKAVFYVVCQLIRANVSEDDIASVLLNREFKISEHVYDQKRPSAYAKAQITSGRKNGATAEARGERLNQVPWADVDKNGSPRPTMRNAVVALQGLGKNFSHDVFKYRKLCGSEELSDDLCVKLRDEIYRRFKFDPGKEAVFDSVMTLAVQNPFHPIRDYLASLKWDGIPRLDDWLVTYMGAEPTALNKAIGRTSLIAAVRRVRSPGVKFDTITVLEGMQQGEGKSTALYILAGAEYFSDQEILTKDRKEQMEQLEGVWIYELGELEGIHKADVCKVKAFASRSVDRGRMAYGRLSERRPRQCVLFGTTNDAHYLRDETGNRRFWPVKTGKIDLAGLQRDRDQLWAEAAYHEAQGESIILPEALWPDATVQQDARMIEHPWIDILANITDEQCVFIEGFQRIASRDVLERVLHVQEEKQTQAMAKQVATLMRKLGWDGPKLRAMGGVGNLARGYQRKATAAQIDAAKKREPSEATLARLAAGVPF